MNKHNASKWMELGSAMLQGKPIQLNSGTGWRDIETLNTVSFDPEQYRIKPESKKGWYRIVLLSEGVFAVSCDAQEESFRARVGFIRWLTDRIEYELPEVGSSQ